jgi:hypothetical protein
MEDAAVDAGLTREFVEIIGSDALADALSQPEMASVRVGMLGVGNPRYFTLVQRDVAPDRARLIRAGMDNPFIPTAEDLDADTVFFPTLGVEVEQRLLTQRVALVRGLGASGKSVLAWLLSLRWQRAGAPAYYLSLRNFPSGSDTATQDLITELTLFAADTALFIVDDCHLNEEAARRIYSSWRELAGSRPALLLIGRETRSRKGSRIHELDLEPLPLRARQDEVRGVFTRLAARYLRGQNDTAPVEQPPPEALDRWVNTFGGDPTHPTTTTDLIAFSAAVQRRIGPLLLGDWTLREEHAAEEMREHYLRPLSDGERQNLVLLSALQKYEIALPASLLPAKSQGLNTSIENSGIVFSRRGGFENADTFFQLAHAALGRLILIASEEHVDEAAAFKALAARHGNLALTAYRQLMAAGEDQIAHAVVRELLANPRILKQMTISGCKGYLHLAEQFYDLPEAETTFKFLASPEGTSAILPNPINDLNYLADFLRYLETSKRVPFKTLYENLAAKLADTNLFGAFVNVALHGPLHFTTDFLRYLEHSKSAPLQTLHSDLAGTLTDPNQLDTFVTAAVQSPLNELTEFLRYLELSADMRFRKLHLDLADRFAEPARLETLLDDAFHFPLHMLVDFFRYLDSSAALRRHALRKTAVEQLCVTRDADTWAAWALRSPADQLEGFLNYARNREAFDRLISALANECRAGSAHADILGESAMAMLLTGAIAGELGDRRTALREIGRVLSLFGESKAPAFRSIVKEAREQETLFRKGLGNSARTTDPI